MARLLTLASLAHLAVSSAHPRACSANATGGPIDVWSAVDTWKHCHFIDVGDYIKYESWNVDTRPPALRLLLLVLAGVVSGAHHDRWQFQWQR